jgi:transcriptional regulator with XRE-family HTH domain
VDFEEFRRRVGANIQRARWLSGKTQEDMKGVTLRYYQDIERGIRNPTLETLYVLAGELEVTVADLVNVPGARASTLRIDERKAIRPPAGRKPRSHPRSR